MPALSPPDYTNPTTGGYGGDPYGNQGGLNYGYGGYSYNPVGGTVPTGNSTALPWWEQAAGNFAADMYGQIQGQSVSTAQQEHWLNEQMNVVDPQVLAFQQQEQGQQYGFQQQQFGVQQAQYGLQGQQLQQQQAHLGAQYGFQQQQDVLTGQTISHNIQDILKNYGYQQQQFGVAQGQLNLAETQGRQSQAASGVYTSAGARGQMQQGFGLQQRGLNISEAQAKTQEQSALFGQQQAQKGLTLTEAEQKEQYGYSTEQVQDGQRQLALQQQSLGISEAQANVEYNNALKQLGLNNVMSVDQLKQQIAAVAGGGYSSMMSMMGQLVQLLPFLGGIFQNNPGIFGGQ